MLARADRTGIESLAAKITHSMVQARADALTWKWLVYLGIPGHMGW